jgi:hypothetical protein
MEVPFVEQYGMAVDLLVEGADGVAPAGERPLPPVRHLFLDGALDRIVVVVVVVVAFDFIIFVSITIATSYIDDRAPVSLIPAPIPSPLAHRTLPRRTGRGARIVFVLHPRCDVVRYRRHRRRRRRRSTT